MKKMSGGSWVIVIALFTFFLFIKEGAAPIVTAINGRVYKSETIPVVVFNTRAEKEIAKAEKAALDFCKSKAMEARILNTQSTRPYWIRFASAEVQFECLHSLRQSKRIDGVPSNNKMMNYAKE